MKKYFLLLLLLASGIVNSQSPQAFNYQAQVRDGSGNLILNQNISFRFNIKQGGPTTSPVYIETHLTYTDEIGQVNVSIGYGTSLLGLFSEIDWSLGEYYLDVEIDTGNGYIAMGVTSILSVPYALYSENSKIPEINEVLSVGNNVGGLAITGLPEPTFDTDATNKFYVDNQVLQTTQDLEGVLNQGNDANNIQIKGLADPVDDQDATNKFYVDNQVLQTTQDLEEVLNQGNDEIGRAHV